MIIVRALLHLFPSAFRDEFGEEMLEQFTRDLRSAREQGRLAAAWSIAASTANLIATACLERLDPTLPDVDEGVLMRPTDWLTDIRLAFRGLRRTPGFLAIAVCTLGLAMGVNAGMFTVVDTVLLKPLPYGDVDRLVYVGSSAPGSDMPPEFGISRELYVQYKERSRLIEDAALYNSFTSTYRDGDRVERIRMSAPSVSLFSTLGVTPLIGRLPTAEDEGGVAVISYDMWQTWYGSDPKVLGRSVQVANASRTIIGVMRPEFRFPVDEAMVWFPTVIRPDRINGENVGQFGSSFVARVRLGVTNEALTAELTTLSHQVSERFGGSPRFAKLMLQYRPLVQPLRDRLLGPISRPLWVLLTAVTMVLLIACANVANLFMVRSEGRHRDLAVRRAIGARRGQLVRLQLSDAIVVAAFAAAMAIILAKLTLPLFRSAAPDGVPRIGDVRLNALTAAYTIGAAIVAALMCGLVPAFKASEPDLTRLREGGRGSTTRRHLIRDGLVVAQTALALVLLIGSGLLLRSFGKLADVKPGYDTRDVFTFQIAPERESLRDGPTFAQFQLAFMDRLRAVPGVQSVGLVENVPLNEGTAGTQFRAEHPRSPDAQSLLQYTFTAGDYFATMGIAVLKGRTFTNDEAARTGNAVVSKSAANLMWPNQDPLGQRIQMVGDSTWFTVIGMVDDVLQNDFRTPADPLIYLPMVGPTPDAWAVTSPAYVLKTPRAELIASEIRALVREVAPEAPMYRIFTMAGLAKDSMAGLSFTMLTLGVAATLALILGSVGLYGVLSSVVAQRTREIGVRMALGAEAGQVRRMVVMQGARVVLLGVVIGVAFALLSTRALSSLLFGVRALDLPTFVAMSVTLLAVGLLASYVPARRASSVDPIASLRE